MQLRANRFGHDELLEVPETHLFEFLRGIGGFEQERRYALVVEDDSPVEWLQSVDDPNVGFPLLEPFLFYPDYAFELPDAVASSLGLDGPEDALVRCVLTLHERAEETTANLLAPIVLNRASQRGLQVVLQDANLPLRFLVFEALQLTADA
ncbi:MAG: flagellar assembly protein FliW [Dehalococcoidia bacterium]